MLFLNNFSQLQGSEDPALNNGGDAIGISLNNSSKINITNNYFNFVIGGKGNDTAGNGGMAAGVSILESSVINCEKNRIKNVRGGDGGAGPRSR